MLNLKQYLDNTGVTLVDIAENTNLQAEVINGIISGNTNIMDISLGGVLLLAQYLKLPLSDIVSCCSLQSNTWHITIDDDWYYMIISFGVQEIRIPLSPVSPTNTKYIRLIAAVHYQHFLDGIIDAKGGQISVYRKQVEIELVKLDVSDTIIKLIDNETLEEMLDAGFTPQEAAADLAPAGDFS